MKITRYFKAFALSGRQGCVRNNPGRLPWARSFCPFRAFCLCFCPFRAFCLHFCLSGRSVCVSAFQGMCFCHSRLFQQMIHSSCQCPDESFHLQCEEEGGEAADVDAALHGNHVDLQVVVS